MRVAYDSQIFAAQRFGGISRYFTRLAETLSTDGAEVGIFCSTHGNEYLTQLSPSLVHGCGLVRYLDRMPSKYRRINQHLGDWLTRQQVRRWKPQVVHETYYQDKRRSPGNIPVVLTVYDMIHERFPDQFGATNRTMLNKRSAVSRADHIICISESTRSDLIEFLQVPPEKVSVILLGFDQLHESPATPPEKVAGSKPFILFVGLRDGYKNFKGLLQAYAASKTLRDDFDLVVFGGKPFDPIEMELIRGLGLDPSHVRKVEGNDRDLGVLYQSAHLFVYPSYYEGFGLPPLEAMAHHCPVATSNSSSIPEVVGDAAELFFPDQVDSIRQSIEKVAYDDAYRTELVSRGLSRLKLFSWEKCAAETRLVYQAVAS